MDENLGLLDQNTSFEGRVFSIEKMVQILFYLFLFPFHECRKMWWYVPSEFENILWWMHSEFFWLLNEWMNDDWAKLEFIGMQKFTSHED
jgi:hypothetical protein